MEASESESKRAEMIGAVLNGLAMALQNRNWEKDLELASFWADWLERDAGWLLELAAGEVDDG